MAGCDDEVANGGSRLVDGGSPRWAPMLDFATEMSLRDSTAHREVTNRSRGDESVAKWADDTRQNTQSAAWCRGADNLQLFTGRYDRALVHRFGNGPGRLPWGTHHQSMDHELTPHLRLARDLRAEGFTSAMLDSRCRHGDLERLRWGAYRTVIDRLPAREAHLYLIAATDPQLAARTTYSHWSAAALYGLPLPDKGVDRVWITRPGDRGGFTRGNLHVVHCPLVDEDVVAGHGVSLTSPARTVVDVARHSSFRDGVMVADAALHRSLCTVDDLTAQLESARRRPGNARARAIVAFADCRSESPGESAIRVSIKRAGLPMPELQVQVYSSNGLLLGRTDFGWAGHRLLGEYDGEGKYGVLIRGDSTSVQAIMAEKRREASMTDEGWSFIRFTKADLRDEARAMERLRRALQRAARR